MKKRISLLPNFRSRPARSLAGLSLLLVLIFILSLLIGRYPDTSLLSLKELFSDELAQRLVFNLRLPRLIAALLLGMSLSAAGTVLQMIFSNPLVEPGFLGVSQGAAFGAAFSIIFLGTTAWIVQSSSALFALLGLAFSYFLARRVRFGGWVLRLVLSGIAVSALFSAGVGILKYFADPLSQLPEITFWMLGGLYSVTWERLVTVIPAAIIGLIIMDRMRWRLNLLALDDDVAFSLGVSSGRERAFVLFAAVLATASMISISGVISWVGLIVPHIARRMFGADGRYSLPAAMLIGGIFAVLSDDLARTLLAGEIPLGILTSFIGAVFFIVLMMSRNIQVQR